MTPIRRSTTSIRITSFVILPHLSVNPRPLDHHMYQDSLILDCHIYQKISRYPSYNLPSTTETFLFSTFWYIKQFQFNKSEDPHKKRTISYNKNLLPSLNVSFSFHNKRKGKMACLLRVGQPRCELRSHKNHYNIFLPWSQEINPLSILKNTTTNTS